MSWLTGAIGVRMRAGATVDSSPAGGRTIAAERHRRRRCAPNDNLTRRLARGFGEDPNEWLAQAARPAADEPTAEMPTGFVKVAAVSEIPDGEMKIVCEGQVVVANVKGRFHAFDNICPHAEGPLGEGFLDGFTVECPWHNGQWDIATGKGLTAFATADIRVFEVRVVDGDVEVKPTAAGASA
jgi:nitrite reductase/ring-hydroxylating ferredoxin subunit